MNTALFLVIKLIVCDKQRVKPVLIEKKESLHLWNSNSIYIFISLLWIFYRIEVMREMDIQLLEHPRLKEKPSTTYLIMSFLLFDVLLFIVCFAFAVSQPIKQSRPILRFNQNGEFTIMQVMVWDRNKGIDYRFSLWWWFERHTLDSVLSSCCYWNGAPWLCGIYWRYGDWVQLGWNTRLVRAAMEGVYKGCYRE